MISGGPIQHLTKGWAVIPFVGKRAHWWIEDTETMADTAPEGPAPVRYYQAACKVLAVTNAKIPALDPGDIPRCKRCQRRLPLR